MRDLAAQWVNLSDSRIVEPIRFEMKRNASPAEVNLLDRYFATCPTLVTPSSFWDDAITLGQSLRAIRRTVKPFDILISAIAINHDAEVVTFDPDYIVLAGISKLRVLLLTRPGP